MPMNDILTRLAALTAKDENAPLPCPLCGKQPTVNVLNKDKYGYCPPDCDPVAFYIVKDKPRREERAAYPSPH
jgi:hypothetical protein